MWQKKYKITHTLMRPGQDEGCDKGLGCMKDQNTLAQDKGRRGLYNT